MRVDELWILNLFSNTLFSGLLCAFCDLFGISISTRITIHLTMLQLGLFLLGTSVSEVNAVASTANFVASPLGRSNNSGTNVGFNVLSLGQAISLYSLIPPYTVVPGDTFYAIA
jgi:hypothetical protein